jgi:antitoxin component of MazEF toxin-antitoxin module
MMVKHLVRHGNSYALILEKPLLELLGIEPDTELKIETDGVGLRIEPIRKRTEPNFALIRERKKEHVRILKRFISALQLTDSKFSREQGDEVRNMAMSGAYSDPAGLSKFEQGLLLEQILDEIFGFGPLTQLLRDTELGNPIVMQADGSFWMDDRRLDVHFDSKEHQLEILRRLEKMPCSQGDGFIEYAMGGKKTVRIAAEKQF